MKRVKKPLLIVLTLALVGVVTTAVMSAGGTEQKEEVPSVVVTRGEIVDKALAVGTIEPRVEISVKSQFSGVVQKQFADVGDFVRAGTPLLEVRPTPTPKELVDAERQIELRQLEVDNLKAEFDRQQQLKDKQLISQQDYDRAKRSYEEAALQVKMAQEQLALLREGRVMTDKGEFQTVVRAPVSGFIIDKMIEIGDPVVPLTSYQEGTVLMKMADMDDLIFRGTVDEIDVGRLQEGMPVTLKIGALPRADVRGVLARIWLKARKEENSTVFPVEIEITDATEPSGTGAEAAPKMAVLRAGYSANADVIIEQRQDILLVPERVVTFAGDTARVTVLLASGQTEERVIETGLSDAIHVEVVSGLDEGARVKEKEVKAIQ
jgi:HlyD family secretion protein